jgi:hypothetical protein
MPDDRGTGRRMSLGKAAWADEVVAAIRAAVGEDGAALLDDLWQRHAARTRPHVTLFGPYDSGKSSLLKRLLVDDGIDVPAWLTISARRETFEADEIAGRTWTFADTPGLASGDARHSQIAQDALLLSDAYLVVLPPQLMTASERDELARLLSGRTWAPDRGRRYAPGAMRIVIARVDEAGVDPTEDVAGFHACVASKRTELDALLAALGIDRASVAVSAVAADPFGAVGQDSQPAPDDYDAGRAWDGIRELVAGMHAAGSDWAVLRADARVRFLLYAGHGACATVERDMVAVRSAIVRSAENVERRERSDAALDGLRDAARADLKLMVDEALRPIVAVHDEAELAVMLERSLDAVLGAWQAKWDAELVGVAGTEIENVGELTLRPAAIALGRLLDLPTRASTSVQTDGTRLRALLSAAPHLRGLGTSAVELLLGKSIPQAQRQLARLDSLPVGTWNPAVTAGFSCFAEADRTRRHVTAVERGGTLLQGLGELAEIASLLEQPLESRRRRKVLEREREVRDLARAEAQRMSDIFLSGSEVHGIEGWLGGVERVRAAIHEVLPVDEQAVAELRQRESELLAVHASLSKLLADAPEAQRRPHG